MEATVWRSASKIQRLNKLTRMNIIQVREHLHSLIDEVDDIYVLNGLYRTLLSDKRQREEYEKDQTQADVKKQARSTSRKSNG